MFGQYIIGSACIRGQLQVALTGKFVQQVGFQVDIAAVFYLLSHDEADTADGAVHAVDTAIDASVGGVVDTGQPAKGKLCLWLNKETCFKIKAFAVFHTKTVGVLLVAGFIRVVAVGFQIGREVAYAGRNIGICATACCPDAIKAKGSQIIFAAAEGVAAAAIAVVDSAAIDTSALELLLKSQLIKVVASFVA